MRWRSGTGRSLLRRCRSSRLRPSSGWGNSGLQRRFDDFYLSTADYVATVPRPYGFSGPVGPLPALQISRAGSQIEIRWTTRVLQQAGFVTGGWADVQGAAPPSCLVTPGPGAKSIGLARKGRKGLAPRPTVRSMRAAGICRPPSLCTVKKSLQRRHNQQHLLMFAPKTSWSRHDTTTGAGRGRFLCTCEFPTKTR